MIKKEKALKKPVVLLAVVLIISGCGIAEKIKAPQVIAGTSMIMSLAADVDPGISCALLVPPGQCPGHFDLRPADARMLKKAGLVILHPYQKLLADKIRKINPGIKIEIMKVPDTTVPENYFKALLETAVILNNNIKPGIKNAYVRDRARQIKQYLEKNSGQVKKIREKKYKVLCSGVQKGFADWLGLEIIGEFGDPEALSVKGAAELIRKGKSADFIISNLAGTHDSTASAINKKLKKPVAVLSNFPEIKGKPPISHYVTLWEYNMGQLNSAIKRLEIRD